jgi:hypothetical protein
MLLTKDMSDMKEKDIQKELIQKFVVPMNGIVEVNRPF